MRVPTMRVILVVVASMLLAVGVAIVLADICDGNCNGQYVVCICEEGICDVDCTLPYPYCVCSCE